MSDSKIVAGISNESPYLATRRKSRLKNLIVMTILDLKIITDLNKMSLKNFLKRELIVNKERNSIKLIQHLIS